MRTIFLISILLLANLSCAVDLEVCSIIKTNQIMCKLKTDDLGTVVSLIKRNYDGSWIKKTYYPETKDEHPAVFVYKYEPIDYDRLCNGVNSFVPDSLKLDCDLFKVIWIRKINKGEEFPLPIINFSQNLSGRTPVSEMQCFRCDYVRTFKRNALTGLQTDRKDYFGLKPGTYCEDFLANDDLFWKPPK